MLNRCKPLCYLCSRSMAHLIDAKARKARLIADAACMSNDQAAAPQHRTASYLADIARNADRYCECALRKHSLTSPSAEGRGLKCHRMRGAQAPTKDMIVFLVAPEVRPLEDSQDILRSMTRCCDTCQHPRVSITSANVITTQRTNERSSVPRSCTPRACQHRHPRRRGPAPSAFSLVLRFALPIYVAATALGHMCLC